MSNIRMSGLISNMDTESIVKQLMSAQRTKETKIKNKQTKLTWSQEKWKDLNTKLYSFYTDYASSMRLQGSYSSFKTTSSNENAVTVTASSTAPSGSYNIVVNQLASAQMYTGAKISTTNGSKLSASSKLTTDLNMTNGTVMKIVSGTGAKQKTVNFTVTSTSTINDFNKACQNAGLNASIDVSSDGTSGRLFVSSKASGADNTFSITTSDVTTNATGDNAKTAIYSLFENMVNKDSTGTTSNATVAIPVALKNQVDSYLNAYTVSTSSTEKQSIIDNIYNLRKNYFKGTIADEASKYTPPVTYTSDQLEAEYVSRYENTATVNDAATTKNNIKANADTYAANATLGASTELDKLGLGNTATKINAQNSKIVYNGALFEQSSNTVNINGLTIEAKQVTDATPISAATPTATLLGMTGSTVTVTKDTQAIYDKVKKFVTEYNKILKEMNTLYYAKPAKGYEPLTDDQKEAMSDSEVEKWETKIKDSLFRRDSTLETLTTSFKSSMASTIKDVTKIDGTKKNMNLATFGIHTSTDYTEYGLLHIDGDSDDAQTKANTDKLKKALEEDPDAVMQTLAGVAKNLYDTMSDKMKSTSLRSALTFYNDKEMTKQADKYKKDITTMESKLNTMENAYYKKFSAMETAMAKLQKSTSALASITG
ncbi:flagellar filament capping protein FliD [Anaeromicropila herbilytica]|uniref:Flagellar hook-associated protein 2 n=1 Tax=Anaeromicropila herbilytica TaxID=2785025 RepID=A0A7R7EPW7_9FIRM|nr:flagellar filament capping protein FliD [Anaeromicropila herbilytica]BCN32555.1 flagellar hook-associated protein 2 [Anaeromicropila herbilytica]